MTELPEMLEIGVIALSRGVTRGQVSVWARQGKLGPLIVGTHGRNTKALRSEVDARLGPLSDEQYAEARRRYENGEHLRPQLPREDAP